MKIERKKTSYHKRFDELKQGETFFVFVDDHTTSEEVYMRIPECSFYNYKISEMLNSVSLLNGNMYYIPENSWVEVVTVKAVVEG